MSKSAMTRAEEIVQILREIEDTVEQNKNHAAGCNAHLKDLRALLKVAMQEHADGQQRIDE